MVETKLDTLAYNREERAVGYFQIRPIRLRDYIERTGSKYKLKEMYDYDKADIRPDAEPDLQGVVDLMKKYPDMKIELSSHTDARGNDAYNEDLSQRRANSAVAWIVAKGVTADRIVAKGYGEKQLQNKCTSGVECTEEEHQLNRRTEFKITAGPTSIVIEKVEKREKKPASTGGKQSVHEGFLLKN